MVIFLNRNFRQSIAFKLLVYFIVTGSILFGTLLTVYYLISGNFANIAIENSLQGVSADMEDSLYTDIDGNVALDESELMLKWGFDALYSNIGYRLIEVSTGKEIIRSVDQGVKGALIDLVPHNIPNGYFLHKENIPKKVDSFRLRLELSGKAYHLDVMRSDLLGQLANEAVLPAIADIVVFAIAIAFILFLTVNIVAIRLIVKPVKKLSQQVAKIQPEDLSKRIEINGVPNELIPISEALNAALDRVESGFEMQKRFVADAAHELRTPLTVLLSRLQLTLDDSEIKGELLADTRYISRIVEQLLDLSRAQSIAGRAIKQINLVPVVKDVISMLAPLSVDSEHDLELISNVSICNVVIDEGEISVVLKNLIENAIKHTPPGSDIIVTINQESLCVEDSGDGIPVSHRENIFDRFWRADQSDMSGSGLGLAIAAEILSHYSANISVSNSEALGGAKFTIQF